MASGASLSGYVLSTTGRTLPASMSSFRNSRSSVFAAPSTGRSRWLTKADSTSARIERPKAPIHRSPLSPPTSTSVPLGVSVDQYRLPRRDLAWAAERLERGTRRRGYGGNLLEGEICRLGRE